MSKLEFYVSRDNTGLDSFESTGLILIQGLFVVTKYRTTDVTKFEQPNLHLLLTRKVAKCELIKKNAIVLYPTGDFDWFTIRMRQALCQT